MIKIENGIKEGKDPFILNGKKIAILSDIHFPFHDERALIAALEYIEKVGFDTLLLNGDVIDNYTLSKYTKSKAKVKFYTQEILMTREFLSNLRAYFPSKAIIYKIGNHEDRFDVRISERIPEFEGLITLEELLQFRENGIQIVDSKQLIKAGKLNILHGHEVRFGGEYIAANLLKRFGENILVGHFHRKQEFGGKMVFEGKNIGAWSVGCLCNLNPDYYPYNKWNHGFAIVEIDNDGYFEVHNKQIENGKVL